jgi:hypothetical protein
MPLEEILRYLSTRIFTPFRIHVSDGSHHDVMYPSQCLPFARSIIVGIPSEGMHPLVMSNYVNIALIHIAKLELLTAPAAASGNGPVSQ